MRKFMVCVLLVWAAQPAAAQENAETKELIGHMGGRNALLVLHASQRTDGGWQLSGEYLLLPTLVRRFLEGERSPEIGVTALREGATPILFGRHPSAELRGTWRAGQFRGMRYAPGGQERERFEFSEEFPSMEGYSANVRCETTEGRYAATLVYAVENGRLKSIDWRSKVAPSGHVCALSAAEQQSFKGGLRFTSGRCAVTLRDLGEQIGVFAEHCTELCGSQAYLEPLIVDRRGSCRLLRSAEAK
jgi:hypothetical protein